MLIYIVECSWGFGDNTGSSIEYVGFSDEEAVSVAKNYEFPDEYNNWARVDVWKDGKFVRTYCELDR